jgi:hypothetical protein
MFVEMAVHLFVLQGKSLSIICGAMKWLKDHENEPLVPEKESNEVQTAAMATTNTTMATPKGPRSRHA